jgi:hypothetical protein
MSPHSRWAGLQLTVKDTGHSQSHSLFCTPAVFNNVGIAGAGSTHREMRNVCKIQVGKHQRKIPFRIPGGINSLIHSCYWTTLFKCVSYVACTAW